MSTLMTCFRAENSARFGETRVGLLIVLCWLFFCEGCGGSPSASFARGVADAGTAGTATAGTATAGVGRGGASPSSGGSSADTSSADVRCRVDSDCPTGTMCGTEADTGIPGGECLGVCDPSAPQACPQGQACVSSTLTEVAACLKVCTATEDCGTGRVCDASTGTCFGSCSSDAECQSGHCDPYTALCSTQTVTADLGVYVPCNQDSDCRSNFCNPVSHRCTTLCRVSSPNCPEDAVCLAVESDNDTGMCYPPCIENSKCADRTLQCGRIRPGSPPVCAVPADPSCLGIKAEHRYGADCSCGADCPDDAICYTESFSMGNPGGYCLLACSEDWECGSTSFCNAAGYCQSSCAQDAECPRGDLCLVPLRSCISLCEDDASCLGGKCSPYTAQCVETPAEGAPMGAPCTKNEDCRSTSCWRGNSSGVCTRFCNRNHAACPDGTVCGNDPFEDSIGNCTRACVTSSDCADLGLICHYDVGERPSYCWFRPKAQVERRYDAGIEAACRLAVERDVFCAESTISPDCLRAAQIEDPTGIAIYDCVSSSECGKAGECASPAPTTIGDDLCLQVESKCGAESANQAYCSELNQSFGWFRPDVRNAVKTCFSVVECGELVTCIEDWASQVMATNG